MDTDLLDEIVDGAGGMVDDGRDHGGPAHSEFPASASARLIACPGSFGLTRKMRSDGSIPPERPSSYAAEGTAAHAVLENLMRAGIHPRIHKSLAVGNFEVAVDQEMIDAVNEFADTAHRVRLELDPTLRANPIEHIERRVSLDNLWKKDPAEPPPLPMFGTVDYGLVLPDGIAIIDFKYGRGVPVEAQDNPQLLYYALGLLLDTDLPMSVDFSTKVKLVIVQPRAPHPLGPVRTAEYLVLDILEWGEQVLRPAVRAALAPNAKFHAGAHCRWCPVKTACPVLRSAAQDAAAKAFDDGFGLDDPDLARDLGGMNPSELANMLHRIPALRAYLDAIEAQAIERLTKDRFAVPGWKVVEKAGRRSWTIPSADGLQRELVNRFNLQGSTVEDVLAVQTVVKVGTPAQVQKKWTARFGVKAPWDQVEALYTTRGVSGRALVPESDARKPIARSASEIFSDGLTPGGGEDSADLLNI